MLKKLSLIAGGVLLATQAQAHHVVSNFDIEEMSSQANLVFHGKVVSVDYRGSKANNGQAPLPHTFVTFEINDVLYGNPGVENRKTFTLRFMGGRSDDGRALLVDVLPKFEVGDEDIVFVTGNGVSECPVVECANGRFRVIDGMVYNEYGQQILQAHDRLMLGDIEKRKEFLTYQLGDMQLTQEIHTDNSGDRGGEDSSTEQSVKGSHLDVNTFISMLSDKIAAGNPNDPMGVKKSARNADKNKPFSLPSPVKGKPIDVSQGKTDRPVANNAQEQREIEAMEKNYGNPVIR